MLTAISTLIFFDCLVRLFALAHFDCDFPRFFVRRELGWQFGLVSNHSHWPSLQISLSTKIKISIHTVHCKCIVGTEIRIIRMNILVLSIFVERVEMVYTFDRTIPDVHDDERIRKFSSTSIRLDFSSDREHARLCELSRRIAVNLFSFDFVSLEWYIEMFNNIINFKNVINCIKHIAN